MLKGSHHTLFVSQQADAVIPTPWGNFRMIAFADREDNWMPHLALIHEHFDHTKPALVRMHSECLTGDIFHSKRCDCGEQLHKALEMTAQEGGVVLYLRQEGRGIGLINKLKAYNLQDLGLNTVDANIHLGLEIDARHYDIAIEMLLALDIKKVHLLTNNPDKIEALEHSPIEVLSRVPLVIEPRKENLNYLKTKRENLGHLF
ncbi:MAG: GTP cyclohydrolase II [Saprospiraceae bacterium]|nr:GTP cyclohydrolase II [Saprospiraceae bacterium]